MIFSSSTFTATVLALAAVSSSARLVQGPSGNEYAKRGLDSTPSQSAQVCYTLTCPNTPTGTTPDSVTGTKTADGNLTCTYSSYISSLSSFLSRAVALRPKPLVGQSVLTLLSRSAAVGALPTDPASTATTASTSTVRTASAGPSARRRPARPSATFRGWRRKFRRGSTSSSGRREKRP